MAKDFADISRLTEAAEVNATNKRESVARLMKAWESKNAKRAAQGTALSTMAVTLAACGGSSSDNTPFSQADIDAATTPIQTQLTSTQAQLATALTNLTTATAAKTAAEAALTTATAAKTAAEAAQAAAEGALATLRTDLGVASDATTTEMMNAITALEATASGANAANAAAQSALADLRADLGVASNATTTEMMAAITALEAGSAEAQSALAALRTDLGVAANASTTDMIAAITALETAASNAAAAGATAQTALATLRTDLGVSADATTTEMMAAITALETSAANAATARDVAEAGLASLRADLGLAADATVSDMIAAITTLENNAANAADDAVAALGIAGITTLAQLNAAYDALANPVITNIVLTANADVGAAFTGNNLANSFLANQATLNAGDALDGGAGVDTLVFTNTGGVFNVTPAGLTSIEVVQSSSTGTGATSIGLGAATSLTKVVSLNSTQAETFANIQTAATVEIDGSTAQIGATFAASQVGASRTGNVVVKNGATVSELNIAGVAGTEFGTIAIQSEGTTANTITLIEDEGSAALAALTTLNLSGSAATTLGTTSAAVVANNANADMTLNAATATGNLTINALNFENVTLGSGSDVLYVGTSQISAATGAGDQVVLVGGLGTDTLHLGAQDVTTTGIQNNTAGDATDDDSISGFELVTQSEGIAANGAAAVTATVDAQHLVGMATLRFTGTQAAIDAAADAVDLVIDVDSVSSSFTIDVATTDSDTDGNDSDVDIVLAGVSASGAGSASLILTGNAFDVLDFGTVADNGATAAVDESAWFTSATINNSTTATSVATVKADEMTSLTLLGSGALTIGALDLVDPDPNEAGTTAAARALQVVNINASALSGSLSLTNAETNALSVTLGGGATNTVALGATHAGDTVTGTTGALDVVSITEVAGTATTLVLNNIDRLDVTSATGADGAIAAANFTSVGAIKLIHGSATVADANSVTVTGLQSGQVVEINSEDDKGFDNDTVTLTAANGVTSLSGVKLTGDEKFGGDTTAAGIISTNVSSLTVTNEAIAAGTAVDNTFTLSSSTVTSLSLAGAGGITVGAPNGQNALTSIDATNHTGNLTVTDTDLFDPTGATVTTGTGSTTTTVAAAMLTNAAVQFDDNGGTDTLAFATTGGDYGVVDVDGFETIAFTVDTAGTAVALNLRDSSGYNTVAISGATGANDFSDNITLTQVASGTSLSLTTTGQLFGNGAGDTLSVTARTATADTLVLTSTNVAGGGVGFDTHAGAIVDINGFETVTLASGGVANASSVDISGSLDVEATTLNVGDGVGNGAVTVAALATNATITTLNLDSGKGAVTMSNLGSASAVTGINVDTGDATSSAKTTVTAGTTAALTTVTASGAGAFEITALTASSLANINAGSVTGNVTLGTSSAALTVASGASITTGAGNDSITMSSANALAINAGGNTSGGKDTLVLVGTQNGGSGVINLAASGDQLTQLNGVAEGVVQTGFESVDVSAITSTGSNGFLITANAAGSTIVGSGYNDTIFGGAGADVITGGAGADTINLGVDGASDTIVVGASSSTEAAMDSITNFAVGAANADVVDLVATTVEANIAVGAAVDVSAAAGGGVIGGYITNGVIALNGANAADINTLAEWIDVAEILATADTADNTAATYSTVAFQFNGNTYVLTEVSASGGDTEATYSIVEFAGLTSITALSTTAAANTIDIM